MTRRDPFEADWRDDLQKMNRLRQRDQGGWSAGSVLELIFGTLTALVAVTWFVAMFYVPDPVPGDAWLGFGGLGITVTGVPTLAIYQLRRGGMERIGRLLQEVTG